MYDLLKNDFKVKVNPIKLTINKPSTKTSKLGNKYYTSYVRPEDINFQSKQVLKQVSPRIRSTLEYLENEEKWREWENKRHISAVKKLDDSKRSSNSPKQSKSLAEDKREEDLQALQRLS